MSIYPTNTWIHQIGAPHSMTLSPLTHNSKYFMGCDHLAVDMTMPIVLIILTLWAKTHQLKVLLTAGILNSKLYANYAEYTRAQEWSIEEYTMIAYILHRHIILSIVL